jgi:UDP-N-acetyl-D-glucosamine dehydrogenase
VSHSQAVQRIGIVGLGYVGLPLAIAFAEAGISVVGVDKDLNKIAALNVGESYVEDVPDGRLRPLIAAEVLRPTKDYAMLEEVEAVVICLPTPLNEHREPDLSVVVGGAEAVARHLRPGALVVLESTTYPGTTREVLLPIFETYGRRVGEDFHLAFCPERVDPGNRRYTIQNTPRLVGGITEGCTLKAKALYSKVAEELHLLSSPESAEMAKILENVFRSVNIALVNELAILCERMEIDVWEVVEAASTKPFGFMPFYPGPGLGGHCIPVDPFYLSWRARSFEMTTEFIELAGRINVGMPRYAFSRIAAALNADKKPLNGSRILILGLSYKANIADLRESPSLSILELLTGSGANVAYHDPHIPFLPDHKLSSVGLTREEVRRADCVVITTDHDAMDLQMVVDSAPRVLDLRNAVRKRLGAPSPPHVDVL